jgi:hypothetical protein
MTGLRRQAEVRRDLNGLPVSAEADICAGLRLNGTRFA